MARDEEGAAACTCAERSADAVREARSADVAAAEDFHPLRIRPYVSLSGHDARRDSGPVASPASGSAGPSGAAPGVGTTLQPGAAGGAPSPADVDLFAAAEVFAEYPADESSGHPRGSIGDRPPVPGEPAALSAGQSAALSGGQSAALLGGPAAGQSGRASAAAAGPYEDEPYGEPLGRPRTRRRLALVGAAGSVVAVLATGAVVSGLFSYEKPDRGSALPDDTRMSVPDAVDPAPTSRTASESVPGSASASADPSPARSSSPDSSPSPSKNGSTSSSSRSAAGATAAPSATSATATASSTPTDRDGGSQVLRRGDEGPEVVELQQRLQQLRLYVGDADGEYDWPVEDAVSRYQRARGIRENGTYGPQTRRSLESETSEP
ncbi:peptidoglycan-binding protein [Streptomyces himalayensis]|uniref:Peptidoglycan-binding protein n=1 Tax=Streptomyces himalayensis subsp. himalayensis TaxID=2756131 RepID=A0A7W0DPB6_9ACTN|nr:peptidoglycan-binding protein [Streptomyces himalayensis]MBA2948788.1 peptidoglycan-binding protein [Streptomyces himalayensis subsp. himalayensis]